MRDVAADRAAVANGRIADQRRRLRERRAVFAHDRRRRQLGVRRQRADRARRRLSTVTPLSSAMRPMSIERSRRRQAQLEQRNQAVSARKQLGAGMLAKQVAGFSDRARAVVVECCVQTYSSTLFGLLNRASRRARR